MSSPTDTVAVPLELFEKVLKVAREIIEVFDKHGLIAEPEYVRFIANGIGPEDGESTSDE